MVPITSCSPKTIPVRFTGARRWIPLLSILVTIVLAAGCAGQPEGDSGADNASDRSSSAESANGPTGENTAHPEKTAPEDASEAGSEKNQNRSGAATEDRAGGAGAQAGDGEAQAGAAAAGDGEARAGNIVAGDGNGGKAEARAEGASRTGKVRLRITSTRGAEFSGTCAVNGKKEDIGGQAPKRLVYRTDGGKLECGIQSRGSGTLEVALIGGGFRAVQSINSSQSAVNLTYSSSGVSVTTQ